MVSRVVGMVSVLLMSVLCTGCWDAKEINDLAIVTASGVDLEKPEKDGGLPTYTTTLQIARPSELSNSQSGSSTSGSGTTQTFLVEQGSSHDVTSTLDAIRKNLSRQLFLGQRQVIVVGTEYARSGILDLLDEVVRNPESRLRTDFFISTGKAEDIVKRPYALNRLPTDAILGLEKQGAVVQMNVAEFIEKLNEKGDPYAMGIQPVATQSQEEPNTFKLDQIAVFQSERQVGWLKGDDVDGFLWLTGSIKNAKISVPLAGPKKTLTARLLREQTSVQPVVRNGKLTTFIHVKMLDDIVENHSGLDIDEPSVQRKVEEALAGEIQRRVQGAMDTLQHRYQSDALGIGEKVYEENPRYWHQIGMDWRTVYSKMPVHVTVTVRVIRNGVT